MKNPPAFARPIGEWGRNHNEAQEGATILDYFAAKAMAALLGNTEAMQEAAKTHSDGNELRASIAIRAYLIANAMLEQRENWL